MRRLVLFLTAFAFAFGFAIIAANAQSCWSRATLPLRLNTLGVVEALELKGDERAAAVRWFNSRPPISDGDWSAVILADLPGGNGLVLIGHPETFCIKMPVPAAAWPRVKALILGESA